MANLIPLANLVGELESAAHTIDIHVRTLPRSDKKVERRISDAINFMLEYCQDARWDVVGR